MRPPAHLHLGRNGTLKMCFHVGKALFIANILPLSGGFHTKMVPHSEHIPCLMRQQRGLCQPVPNALNSLETCSLHYAVFTEESAALVSWHKHFLPNPLRLHKRESFPDEFPGVAVS